MITAMKTLAQSLLSNKSATTKAANENVKTIESHLNITPFASSHPPPRQSEACQTRQNRQCQDARQSLQTKRQ